MPFGIACLAFSQMLSRQNSTVVTTKTNSLIRLDLQFDDQNTLGQRPSQCAHLLRLAHGATMIQLSTWSIYFLIFFYAYALYKCVRQNETFSHSSFGSHVVGSRCAGNWPQNPQKLRGEHTQCVLESQS